jgi:DNA invertase Pin-like site-specific DNA recombinase
MTDNDKTKIAVIYSRSATYHGHGKDENITRQHQECEGYARIHGYKILTSFSDAPCSGMKFENRNGWLDMITFLENTPGCAVLMDNMARIARNYELCDELMYQLKMAGAELIFTQYPDFISAI